MELLPVIYNSLLIVCALALIVVIFSYITFKIRKSAKEEIKEPQKEVPPQVKILIKKSKQKAAEIEKKKSRSSKDRSSDSRKSRSSSVQKSSHREKSSSSSHYKKKRSHSDQKRKTKRIEILNQTFENGSEQKKIEEKEETKKLDQDFIANYDDESTNSKNNNS